MHPAFRHCCCHFEVARLKDISGYKNGTLFNDGPWQTVTIYRVCDQNGHVIHAMTPNLYHVVVW